MENISTSRNKVLAIFSNVDRMNKSPLQKDQLLRMLVNIAKQNGMDSAIEDTRDFDEFGVGFYMRIYLRMHKHEITYVPGSEIAFQVDINDRSAILQKIGDLILLKNIAVRKQEYSVAAAYRDQERWLHNRLVELKN